MVSVWIPEPEGGTYVLFGPHLYFRDRDDDDPSDMFRWKHLDTDMYDEWDNLVRSAEKSRYPVVVMEPGKRLL